MDQQRTGERGEVFRPSLSYGLYLVCALIGLGLMVVGSGYRTPNVGLVGPALVPLLVGALLLLLSLVPLVAALLGGSPSRTRSFASGAEENQTPFFKSAVLRIAALIGITVFFALGFEFLGFPVTASVSAFAGIVVLGGRPVVAAPVALILPALLWVVFVELLGLTLPIGDLLYALLYS